MAEKRQSNDQMTYFFDDEKTASKVRTMTLGAMTNFYKALTDEPINEEESEMFNELLTTFWGLWATMNDLIKLQNEEVKNKDSLTIALFDLIEDLCQSFYTEIKVINIFGTEYYLSEDPIEKRLLRGLVLFARVAIRKLDQSIVLIMESYKNKTKEVYELAMTRVWENFDSYNQLQDEKHKLIHEIDDYRTHKNATKH